LPSLSDFKVSELNRLRQGLCSPASHCRRRLATANNDRRNEDSDFVNQVSVENIPCHLGAAFNQDALDLALSQLVQNQREISAVCLVAN
jgi:hypothetical protein